MFVFTTIALRLIGLAIAFFHSGDILTHVLGVMGLVGFPVGYQILPSVVLVSVPAIVGVAVAIFARPIAQIIVPAEAVGAAPPEVISEARFTQIGVFLIGVFMLANALARAVGGMLMNGAMVTPWFDVASIAIGLALIFGSGLLAGVIKQLRH